MPQFGLRPTELDAVSPRTARKLVDTLYQQTTSLTAGGAVFMALGLIGFLGTGSRWYFAGFVVAACTCMLRLWQTRRYARAPDSAPPSVWARRSLAGAWLTAASWGAWSAVLLFEPEKSLVIMVLSAQSACMIGGAVRNAAVRAIASGQVFLTLTPVFVACLLTGSGYLNIYAGFVALLMVAALALTRHLNRQTRLLLRQDEEKSELVASLEAAKQDLEVINRHLETLVSTDALTGAANRRAFDLNAAREWRRCLREQEPMSLLLLDVDYFKLFNDLYGHIAGDVCLQEIAAAAAVALRRPADGLARYGGEEFVAILPNTPLDGAVRIAEHILRAVSALGLGHEASPFGHVTVSIGAACMVPVPGAEVQQLTARADAALYDAKRSGRNRVKTASKPMMRMEIAAASR
nr:diguanylate cyclase [uncultured Rhodopila sp.]